MRLIIAALALTATPALAEVRDATATGFVSAHSAFVAAPPAKVWTTLIDWPRWWPAQHSYSGKAPTLDLRAGGALAERWAGGDVLHATVLNIQRRKLLRLGGGFGPLQALTSNAILDLTLAVEGAGTRLTMTYRVGGPGTGPLAAPVDGVMASGFANLVKNAAAN